MNEQMNKAERLAKNTQFINDFLKKQVLEQKSSLALGAVAKYGLHLPSVRLNRLAGIHALDKLVEDLEFSLSSEMEYADKELHRRHLGKVIGIIESFTNNLFTSGHKVDGEKEVELLYSLLNFDNLMLHHPLDSNLNHPAPSLPYLANSVWGIFQEAQPLGHSKEQANKAEAQRLYNQFKEETRAWLKKAIRERRRLLEETLDCAKEMQEKRQKPKKQKKNKAATVAKSIAA